MGNQCTVKSVLSEHLATYRQTHTLSPHQGQVCSHILTCHTPALGGSDMHLQCDRCEYMQPCYHACRDRHCPSCQSDASRAWCERQRETLLPVTYHHLVFTLPSALNGWVSLHPKLIYRELFASVWDTMSRFGADPKRLNGQIGMSAVLHTWGENLARHVHLHCLVPGGALGSDALWHPASDTWLFPVRALSRRFRGRMVSALRRAAEAGKLARISNPGEIDEVLDALMEKPWVVFSKPCPTQAGTVIDYLGRYTHRIAISDQRLIESDRTHVCFSYKDYRADGKRKTMMLEAPEFIRRFLLHVLPKGMMRIRHYGFLANSCRGRKLKQVRQALGERAVDESTASSEITDSQKSRNRGIACPRCQVGRMQVSRTKAIPEIVRELTMLYHE